MIEYIIKFMYIVYTFFLLLKCFSKVNPVQRFLFKCNIKSLIFGDLLYCVLFMCTYSYYLITHMRQSYFMFIRTLQNTLSGHSTEQFCTIRVNNFHRNVS